MLRFLATLLIVALTLVHPALADIDADIQAADLSAQSGDFEGSRAILTRLIESGELDAERQAVMLHSRGTIEQILGNPEAAIEDFNRAITLSATYTDALYNRGVALMAVGRPADAANDFAAVLREEPDAVDAYAVLAEAQAYSIQKTGGYPLRWPANIKSIPYVIHEDGSADIQDGSDFAQIQKGFDDWQSNSCTYLSFNYTGTSTSKNVTSLGSWSNGSNEVVWVEDNSWGYGSYVLGVTAPIFSQTGGPRGYKFFPVGFKC